MLKLAVKRFITTSPLQYLTLFPFISIVMPFLHGLQDLSLKEAPLILNFRTTSESLYSEKTFCKCIVITAMLARQAGRVGMQMGREGTAAPINL